MNISLLDGLPRCFRIEERRMTMEVDCLSARTKKPAEVVGMVLQETDMAIVRACFGCPLGIAALEHSLSRDLGFDLIGE